MRQRVVAILALITGGSAAIGLACAQRFDREGVTVGAFLWGRRKGKHAM
ncbi:hypothetical protein [Litorivivens sp.]